MIQIRTWQWINCVVSCIKIIVIDQSGFRPAGGWNIRTGVWIDFGPALYACSHEPWAVDYPGVMITPEQALPRVHMIIYRPRATLPRVNFIAPGQVHRHLITTNLSEFLWFLHKLLQRINFKHVYLFLVLSGTFCWEIYSNINNEHAQDFSCPGATFAFCSRGQKLPRQGGYNG